MRFIKSLYTQKGAERVIIRYVGAVVNSLMKPAAAKRGKCHAGNY